MKTVRKTILFIVAMMIAIPTAFTANAQATKLYKGDAAKYRQVMNQYKNKSPYSNVEQFTKYTLYDLNRDGRKDLIISPWDPPQASSEPLSTYVVMKVGKKYISRKLPGEFVKAGPRSLLLEYKVTTCTAEWAQGKGRGFLHRITLLEISKTGDFVLKAEYRHERNYSDAPYTTSYNDGNGNNIGATKYNELINNAKLKELSFKKMTTTNVKKVR